MYIYMYTAEAGIYTYVRITHDYNRVTVMIDTYYMHTCIVGEKISCTRTEKAWLAVEPTNVFLQSARHLWPIVHTHVYIGN